ncbi:hypothetical protein DICPUDRAFT_76335 [Dictyostelium purpureum]|uniref:Uncharacterized protein n=1 Tax=Dictyostelium purpureum TaxID=5786 RepID=F0ZDB0_DICPU|nr:uncharacterized protein DICPUDRAFT_76335 [Dictyostelium purpureum]EGC38077.1 hypothetical protein DICPUDRAFT_76335 [Dictyostelium purpureum]|eukprot:XP_003285384.1 hypothetical protein DICPUDRAFT_76335 [Dictyostelium purpureum]
MYNRNIILLSVLFIILLQFSKSQQIDKSNYIENNYLSLSSSSSSDDSSSSDGWVEPPACGDLTLCLFTEINYKGFQYEFSIYDGYVNLPDQIKRNITSFVSNAKVCFISFSPNFNTQQISFGEFLSNYYIIFGNSVDSIKSGEC